MVLQNQLRSCSSVRREVHPRTASRVLWLASLENRNGALKSNSCHRVTDDEPRALIDIPAGGDIPVPSHSRRPVRHNHTGRRPHPQDYFTAYTLALLAPAASILHVSASDQGQCFELVCRYRDPGSITWLHLMMHIPPGEAVGLVTI